MRNGLATKMVQRRHDTKTATDLFESVDRGSLSDHSDNMVRVSDSRPQDSHVTSTGAVATYPVQNARCCAGPFTSGALEASDDVRVLAAWPRGHRSRVPSEFLRTIPVGTVSYHRRDPSPARCHYARSRRRSTAERLHCVDVLLNTPWRWRHAHAQATL